MLRLGIALALVLVSAAAARAQDGAGASVSGTVAALNMASRTSTSISGAFSFKFNRVAGLELETTWLPDMQTDFDQQPVILIYPPPTFENRKGRAVLFTNSVRVDIPTTMTRLRPYFVAGAGVAHTRQSAVYTYSIYSLVGAIPPATTIGNLPTVPTSLLRPIAQPITTSEVNLALTLGGGLNIGLVSRLSLDVDLRMFRLLGQNDRNAGRFGLGARYRFGR